jgi:undecaprenyl-diphosphatase
LRNQRTLLFVCLLFLASFLIMAQLKSSFITVDLQTNSWAATIQTDPLTAIAVAIAYVFDTASLAAASLILAAYLFYRNHRRYSVLLLAGMGGDALIVSIAKTVVHSPRPLNGLLYDAGFSFPSGHTTASIVFCGLLTYLIWQHWKSPKSKAVSTALSISVTSIVGFDRIYLNVHWVSDVVGGCLLGLFWLTFTLWVFRCAEKTEKIQGFKGWAKPKVVSAQLLLIKTLVGRRLILLQVLSSSNQERRHNNDKRYCSGYDQVMCFADNLAPAYTNIHA